jgi:hypothetical protein
MSGRVSPNQELDQPGDQLEAEMAAFQPVRKPKCFSKDAVAKHEQLKKEAADRKKNARRERRGRFRSETSSRHGGSRCEGRHCLVQKMSLRRR